MQQPKRLFLGSVGAIACALLMSGCASLNPAPTLADTLAARPELSTLNRLVTQAGLQDTLRGEAALTVLAPNDEAFKAVPKATLDALAADPARLKAVLGHHVVLVGRHHDLDQHQHLIAAIIRQWTLHADRTDVLAQRNQAGPHRGDLRFTGVDHLPLRFSHQFGKRLLTTA